MPTKVEGFIGIYVIDVISIKSSYGTTTTPGTVAVLDGFRSEEPQAHVGRTASIRTPDGSSCLVKVDAVRDHGKTISLYFQDMNAASVPIGSLVDLGD